MQSDWAFQSSANRSTEMCRISYFACFEPSSWWRHTFTNSQNGLYWLAKIVRTNFYRFIECIFVCNETSMSWDVRLSFMCRVCQSDCTWIIQCGAWTVTAEIPRASLKQQLQDAHTGYTLPIYKVPHRPLMRTLNEHCSNNKCHCTFKSNSRGYSVEHFKNRK